jgi:hypothetical protein
MNEQPGNLRRFLRGQTVRLIAVAMILALYGFARVPDLPKGERKALAAHFAFAKLPLPAGPGDLRRTVRPVHPTLARIAGWISSVGAGVALNDLDGDGLPNDACTVDVRVDRVVVAPVPSLSGTGSRYAAFTLDPEPQLPHDRRTMAPMGCVPGDWNEDGRMDALVYYWGRPPVLFLRRSIDGAALSADLYRKLPLAPGSERWYTNALTSADVDGDGHLDLIVGNYFPDGARILDARDGGTEHMHRSMSRSENGGVNRLFLGQGGASGPEPTALFRQVPDAFDPQTTLSWTLAVGAADLDGDLLPEIYFGNDFGNDRLLYNRSTPGHPRFSALIGHKGLTTPTSKVLGRDSFKGMGIDFVDMNGDGRLDMYVSNIAQNWALEESHFVWVANGGRERMMEGVAPFEDESEDLGLSRSGWGWDARFADFDSDGVPEAIQAVGFLRGEKNRWPELHELAMGNDNHMTHLAAWHHFASGDDLSGHLHDPFFVRAADGRYYDLAPEVGIGQEHVSRGISLADVDGDGDLDFAVANQWETSWFFRNDSPRKNASLVLDLGLPAGAGRSRPAIGAEVTVHQPDGRRMVAQVDGGSGHSGKRAPQVHFGLGRLDPGTALQVDVRWRDGRGAVRQRTFHLEPGDHRLILDADGPASRLAGQGNTATASGKVG